jgi:hypothetical protein
MNKDEDGINDALKTLEDRMDLLPLGHECAIGMAMAIQVLYQRRDHLRTERQFAAKQSFSKEK